MITVILMLMLNQSAFACDLESEKKGYWFYNECEVEEVELKEEEAQYKTPPPIPAPSKMMDMHPKELEKLLNEQKEFAIWKQTPESVTDYYVVFDVIRRKALAFTAISKYVMLMKPELNARSQYAIVSPGRKVATKLHNNSINNTLNKSRRNFAIVMFSKRTCSYCPVQKNILKYFKDRHNWSLKDIDIDDRPDLQARFNVTVTPMTIIIEKGSERWMPVSVGVESLADIESGVERAVRMMRGDISPEQYILNDYEQGGFFDPSALRDSL